jgi:hypothetical protein
MGERLFKRVFPYGKRSVFLRLILKEGKSLGACGALPLKSNIFKINRKNVLCKLPKARAFALQRKKLPQNIKTVGNTMRRYVTGDFPLATALKY